MAPLTLKGSSMMLRAAVLPPLVATYRRLCVTSTAVLYSVWPGATRNQHLYVNYTYIYILIILANYILQVLYICINHRVQKEILNI